MNYLTQTFQIFDSEFRNDFPKGDFSIDKSWKIITLRFNKTVQEDQAQILLEKYKMLFTKKDKNVDAKLLFLKNGENILVTGIEIHIKN